MPVIGSDYVERTVHTKRAPKNRRSTMTKTAKVRLHTYRREDTRECFECGEPIAYGDVYEYRVVRMERKCPRTLRYKSHLEYRYTHSCCPRDR